jgi:large subunit ribosomal protein L18
MPRLSVFKSNLYIYAQLINDDTNTTIASASSMKEKGAKVVAAEKVGAALAKTALTKGVKKVVFDRGGFKFTGRVKALAEGARKGGLEF